MTGFFKRFSKLKCERKEIRSTIISSVGYNDDEKVIEIEFKRNSKVWRYLDVSSEVWEQFENSRSKGKFFLEKIRSKYKRERVR